MVETVDAINARLLDRYGKDLYRQRYRLVWANDQLEKRKGTYRDFEKSTLIFLREVIEIREVPKYPDFQGYYVLETSAMPGIYKDIIDHNGYEPIFVFRKNDGTPLEPNWRAIEFFINRLNTPVTPQFVSDEEIQTAQEKQDEEDAKYFMELLENPTEVIKGL